MPEKIQKRKFSARKYFCDRKNYFRLIVVTKKYLQLKTIGTEKNIFEAEKKCVETRRIIPGSKKLFWDRKKSGIKICWGRKKYLGHQKIFRDGKKFVNNK